MVGEDKKRYTCVTDKAQEVGESRMGDAIGGPRAVVVHFWDTSTVGEDEGVSFVLRLK